MLIDLQDDRFALNFSEYKRIKFLLATDGSAPALRAVKYAAKPIALMGSSENKVTLVSVHDETGLRHAKALVAARPCRITCANSAKMNFGLP